MQEHKIKLQKAIAKIIKASRKKSITKSADEIGMGKSIWSDLENGIKDHQIFTLWRTEEVLGMKPLTLVEMVEKELGENFSFLENADD